MIDWQSVVFNGCWIVGLAILLALVSYNQWAKQDSQLRLPFLLQTTLQICAYILIGIGLAATSSSVIERLIWLILMILLVVTKLLESKSQRQADRSTVSDGI